MKKKFLLKGLLVSLMLLCSAHIWAYDFYAKNDDGKTIYYNITSSTDRTCEVTYYSTFSGENRTKYTGNIGIPNSVNNGSTTYAVTGIGDYAFYWCSVITDIEMPSTITSIGSSAFDGCSGLIELVIPSSVTSIGDYTFRDCSSLTQITIPDAVTSIGKRAFYGLICFIYASERKLCASLCPTLQGLMCIDAKRSII